jgi:Uri superfamily endonuclease
VERAAAMIEKNHPSSKAGMPLLCTDAAQAPSVPGAYVLLIDLDEPLTVTIAGKAAGTLDPGRYLYCGSAWGAGGLRGRLARHTRRSKAIRWHVDQLTEAGTVAGAWLVPGGTECALVAACGPLPVPVDGFGSSDCWRCRSHLLHWPAANSWPPKFDGPLKRPVWRARSRSRVRKRTPA